MSYSNIKVCCRFRPRNELEIKQEAGSSRNLVTYRDNSVIIDREGTNRFNFDHVFTETSTQEEVFNVAALPVVEDMLKGYNCTIFVYGQTSSGKTHSMAGSPSDPGLTPRIVEKIFDHIYQSDEETEFTVCISYVEIYLEKIRDLLNPEHENLKLREGGYREGIWIQGVTEQYASCYEDVLAIMKTGTGNRSVGETKMNKRSSRSHSVFILTLSQDHHLTGTFHSRRPELAGTKIVSKLILVDLAGSEKVGKTGATGLLLKQAQHTNKSLATLGMVIKSLTENASHIPYRNSKLTRILTDSLGGNSKTSLIVTCSPSTYNITETVSTLRFGTQVKTIKNKVRRNVEKSVEEYKRLLHNALARIEELESERQSPIDPCEIRSGNIEEVKELGERLAMKERELLEISDAFQEQLAAKENEIEILNEEYLAQIAEKEREIKEKVIEIDTLKTKLLVKENENLKDTPTSHDNGPSKHYYKRMMESRQEMIAILEVALRSAEQTLKTQQADYDRIIRSLKDQANDMRDALYKPAVSRTTRNLIVPVKRKKKTV